MDESERAARMRRFFDRHFRSDRGLRDLSAIQDELPDDVGDLQLLEGRCMETGRKAMHAGRHLEMLRLEGLSRQLKRLVEKKTGDRFARSRANARA